MGDRSRVTNCIKIIVVIAVVIHAVLLPDLESISAFIRDTRRDEPIESSIILVPVVSSTVESKQCKFIAFEDP